MKLARLLILPLLLLTTAVLRSPVASAEGGTLSISGVVWQDTNADGIRQPEEPGIPDFGVELGTTYNGQFFYNNALGQPLYPDKGGNAIRTDATGAYKFENLNPGPYSVRLFGGGTYDLFFFIETSPVREGSGEYSTSVTLDSQSINAIDFGLARSESKSFTGRAWIDARPVSNPVVRAFVDGTDCTGKPSLLPTDQPINRYSVNVAPAVLIPGCGEAGKKVTFTVNGHLANETADWSPPAISRVPILPPDSPAASRRGVPGDLTVGAPFGYLVAYIDYAYIEPSSVKALVEGKDCGNVVADVSASLLVIIPSDSVLSGCGRFGVSVVLEVDGQTVGDSIPWRPANMGVVELPGKPAPDMPPAP